VPSKKGENCIYTAREGGGERLRGDPALIEGKTKRGYIGDIQQGRRGVNR